MKTSLMSVRAAALALFTAPWVAQGVSLDRNFLAGSLQPQVVAQTLVKVEDEWRSQAASYAECGQQLGNWAKPKDCAKLQQSFAKSCTTVVEAVVKGSSGDQNRVGEYMNMVCGQPSLMGWHKDRCLDLRQAIDGALQFNEGANRMHFDGDKLCTSFWSNFAESERKRIVEQKAAEKEQLIKANEKAQALAEKKKQEEAQKEVAEAQARQKREAAAKVQEATEAKAREAAEKLAAMKAEAEAVAKAAADKVDKAHVEATKAAQEHEKAAEEHRQRLAEHERAEEHLRNITSGSHEEANATTDGAAPEVNATLPVNTLIMGASNSAKAAEKTVAHKPIIVEGQNLPGSIIIAVNPVVKVEHIVPLAAAIGLANINTAAETVVTNASASTSNGTAVEAIKKA